MGLMSAAVCIKGGKALVSRQFVEITKSRVEGLLMNLIMSCHVMWLLCLPYEPKLMSSDKDTHQQHT